MSLALSQKLARRLSVIAALAASALLAACAGQRAAPAQPVGLFNDALFAPPSVQVQAADVFALDDNMRNYLRNKVWPQVRALGPERALIAAINAPGELKLDYDASSTRNAREAFAARSGNCLSLVIMAAAFAQELQLNVRFQNVYASETWERANDLYFFIGHVNLSFGARPPIGNYRNFGDSFTTIDFLPGQDLMGQRFEVVAQARILAMYMNNKAAEALVAGKLNDAYAWVRGAVAQDPTFATVYNTLGVVYQRQGALPDAERALRHALLREPSNTHALGNLVTVLKRQERPAEAEQVAAQLRRMQPTAPFADFEQGLVALRAKNFPLASTLFERELARQPDHHEFHFWLAIAQLNLGRTDSAREHLRQALANSITREQQALYGGKLSKLQATRLQ